MRERRQHEVRTYEPFASLRSATRITCAGAGRPCDPRHADPCGSVRSRLTVANETHAAATAPAQKRSAA